MTRYYRFYSNINKSLLEKIYELYGKVKKDKNDKGKKKY